MSGDRFPCRVCGRMFNLSSMGVRTHCGPGPGNRCAGSRLPPSLPIHKDARAFVGAIVKARARVWVHAC